MSNLGEKLRQARLKNDYSTYDVHKLCEIHFTTIAAYERGEKVPSIRNLKTLAKLYGVTFGWLLGDDLSWFDKLPKKIQGLIENEEKLIYLEMALDCDESSLPPLAVLEVVNALKIAKNIQQD